MSKCISSHGEYSEHEPGDPCPWCGEYDMPRIIAERDEALARIKAVRDVHTGTVWPGVADKPICDACDQMWPCETIRALD